MAENKGMATGILVTCSVTHATPAAFIAHVNGREEYENIALGYLDTPIDIFIGGGMDYFIKRKNDTRNLVDELTRKGYEISTIFDEDINSCLLYTSPSPRDRTRYRMPSSA